MMRILHLIKIKSEDYRTFNYLCTYLFFRQVNLQMFSVNVFIIKHVFADFTFIFNFLRYAPIQKKAPLTLIEILKVFWWHTFSSGKCLRLCLSRPLLDLKTLSQNLHSKLCFYNKTVLGSCEIIYQLTYTYFIVR